MLTEVDAYSNTKVEDVKKMIADNIAKTEPKNNAITEPNAYAHCQDRGKLSHESRELQDTSTLAESRVRGTKVILSLSMDRCKSDCDASVPSNFVDGSSSESDGPPSLVSSSGSSSERDGPPNLVVSGSSSESDD